MSSIWENTILGSKFRQIAINRRMESFDKNRNTSFFDKVPLLTTTYQAWLLVCLYPLAKIPTAVQISWLTKLSALIPQFY